MKYERGKSSDEFFLRAIETGRLLVTKAGVVTNTKTGKVVGQKSPFINLKEGLDSYGIATYRLVWLAFNGCIPEGLRVYRKDLQAGNGIENLEVKSVADKNRELKTGLNFKAKPGASNPQAKFTEEQVLSLRREYKQKPFSIRKRSQELNTSHIVLSGMLKGKTYTNVPDAVDVISRKWCGIRKATPRAGISMPGRIRTVKPKVIKEKPVPIPKPIKQAPTVIFDEDAKKKRLELIKSLTSKMKAKEI